MFYNVDLLNKPKSRLGIIWLAATIGNRSSFKKLSKADVGRVDLVKICQQLAAPDEAMALRLSSQLLYGTVRIYEQQLDSLHRAAEAMQFALKKSFLQPTSGSAGAEISGLRVADPNDLSLNAKHRSSASITLKPNEYCYVGEFFFDYAQELGRVLGRDPEEIYQERGFGSSASDSQRGAAERQGRSRAGSVYEREKSLPSSQKPSWQLPNTGYGPAFSASIGDSPLDQNFGFDGFDLGGADIDLGLFDNLDAEATAAAAAAAHIPTTRPDGQDVEMMAAPGRDRAVADQLEQADWELGQFHSDRNRAGILAAPYEGVDARKRNGSHSGSELSVGRGRDGPQGDRSLDLGGQLLGNGADDMVLDFGPTDGGLDFYLPTPDRGSNNDSDASRTRKRKVTDLEANVPGPATGEAQDEMLSIEQEFPPSPKRPRLRSRKLPVDKQTQLTQEEMRSSRQDYVEHQAVIRAKVERAKRLKKTDLWAAGMVGIKLFGPTVGPWAEMVTEVLMEKEESWATFKTTAQAEYTKRRGTVYVQDAAESLMSAIVAAASDPSAAKRALLSGGGGGLPIGAQPTGMILSERARGKQRAISPPSSVVAQSTMAGAAGKQSMTMTFDQHGNAIPGTQLLHGREGSVALSSVGAGGRRGSVDINAFSFGPGLGGDGGMFDLGDGGLGLRSRQNSLGPAPIFDSSRQGSVARSIGGADLDFRSLGDARGVNGQLTPLNAFVPWSQPLDAGDELLLESFSQRLPPAYLLSPGMASMPRRSVTPAIGRNLIAGSAVMGPSGGLTNVFANSVGATQEAADTQTTATESQVERDLNNFLKYATKLFTKKKEQDQAPLCLTDVAPVGVVDRTTACKAFYNTLVLATSGKMQVRQTSAYGPIRMGLVTASS